MVVEATVAVERKVQKTCVTCGRPFTHIAGRPGRPPIACSAACRQFKKSWDYLWALQRKIDFAPEAAMALRKELWLLGNDIARPSGRKPGTKYLVLTLECGHSKEEKHRTRVVYGVSRPDPAPKTSHCSICKVRMRVVSSTVEVQGG